MIAFFDYSFSEETEVTFSRYQTQNDHNIEVFEAE